MTLASLTGTFMEVAAGLTTLLDLTTNEVVLIGKMQTAYETELPAENHPDYAARLAARDEALAWLSEQFLANDERIIAKSENYIRLLWQLGKIENAYQERAKETREKAAVVERHANRVRDRLMQAMKAMDRERIETPSGTVRIQANPGRLEVLEEMAVPKEFIKTVVVTSVDKMAIKAFIESTGETPAGCELVKSDSLRIS